MEQRLRTVTIEIGTFILLCGIDLLVFSITGHGIPCAFRLLTGYLCPGCGITHACIAILHGDLQGAFRDNALSVTLLPVLLLFRRKARGIYQDRKARPQYSRGHFSTLMLFNLCFICYS